MRTKLRGKFTLLFMMCAVLLAVPAVAAIADQLQADADALAIGTGQHTNSFSGNQQPGTTQTYPFSATVNNTGNANNDVFAASGDKVSLTNSFAGDWKSASGSGPPTVDLLSYGQNFTGVISITVPCDAAANTSKTMTVTVDAVASNSKVLTGDPTTLNYTITASSGSPAASCDSTAPDTTIDTKPNDPSNNASPSFTFSGTDNVTSAANLTFECKLDGGTFAACTSPKSLTGLSEGSHTFSVRAKDAAGNTDATPATYTWNVDTTAPVVTATPDRSADHNGWYNQALTVSFSGSDASGIASCDPAVNYSGPDSGTASLSGSCTDNAGNSASGSFNFKYDATKPSTTATPDRTADHNGWYNHAVTFSFDGTDATSGIDSCSADRLYDGPDGTNLTVNGTCTDNAGNTSEPGVSSAFDYDGTAPNNVAGAPARAADHNGWYNHAVNIDFNGTDATSGIDSCTSSTYSGPDGSGLTVNGSCTDVAGNSTNGTSSAFKYDATAPSATATPARSADQNGWYNHAVTFSFSGNDATSGIAGCDNAVNYSGPDSGSASVSGTCTDNAGNQSASGTFNFKYDATAPAITSLGATTSPNSAGWYKNAVDNTFKAADGMSGFSGHSDPYNFTQSSGAQEGNAVTIASGQVTDVAGNSAASINSAAYKIDLSDPTNVTFQGGPAADGSYYFGDTPAQPTCTANDAISGLKSCVVTGYSTAVGTHTMTATATDNADRTATATAPRTYTVKAWTFSGFYQPVDMNGVYNTVKGGSTVPLKFELFKGTTELTDTSYIIQPLRTQKIDCVSGATTDDIELLATGGTSLRYDTTGGQYIYNWKTPTGAGSCYKVTVSATDGSSITAYFKLK